MTPKLIKTLGAGVLACGVATIGPVPRAVAQTVTTEPAGAQAFSPENAIVNTAIPFSVGAREAQQALRGSFGWATFQEGLVQGSYFRFDPDGYARFSPSPRLDTDVFEVICRPRTYVCMARKGAMTLTLTSTGQIQIKMELSTTQDQFFLNDGFAELQVPPRVLGTLDQQLETLLGSGGTLVTRRNGDVLEEVPLTGFPIVAAYLRWVVARQDYTVLPAEWPVPKSGGPNPDTLTQPVNWNGAGRAVAVPVAAKPAIAAAPTPPLSDTDNLSAAAKSEVGSEAQTLAALQAEVAFLRDMLIAQTGAATTSIPPVAVSVPQPAPQHAQPPTQPDWTRETTLQSDLTALDQELADMSEQMRTKQMDAIHALPVPDEFGQEARHLHYLTVNMGLDAKTAIMILQLREADQSTSAMGENPSSAELLTGLTPATTEAMTATLPTQIAVAPPTETPGAYQPLTDYFQSLKN